jgi:hypothetical protein
MCMHNQVADCDAGAVEDLQDVWNSIQADVSAGAPPGGDFLAMGRNMQWRGGSRKSAACMTCACNHVHATCQCAQT